MKKYHEPANRRTIPNLTLYTWLLGMFYCFTGLNCVVAYLHFVRCGIRIQDELDPADMSLMLGVVMLLVTPIMIIDKRKSERNLGAVVGSGFVHLFTTLMLWLQDCDFYMLVVYMIEWVAVGIAICCFFLGRRIRRNNNSLSDI